MRRIVHILSEDTTFGAEAAAAVNSVGMIPIAVESLSNLFARSDIDSEVVVFDSRHRSFEDIISDTQSIVSRFPRTQIVLGVVGWLPQHAVAAVRAGASNVVDLPVIQDAMKFVLREAVCQIQRMRESMTNGLPESIAERLSDEESYILSLLMSGKTAKQIGVDLDLSIRTIHYRKKAILRKLGADNRSEAIEIIRRIEGSTSMPPSAPSTITLPANPSTLHQAAG